MRALFFLKAGWIFAGDSEQLPCGSTKITNNVIWLYRWEEVGIDGVLKNPKDKRVYLRPTGHDVHVPKDCVLFSIPVADDWGV